MNLTIKVIRKAKSIYEQNPYDIYIQIKSKEKSSIVIKANYLRIHIKRQ